MWHLKTGLCDANFFSEYPIYNQLVVAALRLLIT